MLLVVAVVNRSQGWYERRAASGMRPAVQNSRSHETDRRFTTVAALGTAQTLAWASSYYLPAMLAAPMARDLGIAPPRRSSPRSRWR